MSRQAGRVTGGAVGGAGNFSGLGKFDFGSINVSKLDLSGLKKTDIDVGDAKKLDGAGDVGDAKKLDGAGDAGDAKKADRASDAGDAKKADAAGDAKKSDEGLDLTTAAAGGALVVGSLLYLDEKVKDENEKVKACLGTCLPSNWDDYVYGDLEKSKLTYQSLETIKAEYPDEEIDPKQPFCDEKKGECGDYCEDKCAELHESALLPGGDLAQRLVDDTVDNATSLVDKVFKPFKDMFGSVWEKAKLPSMILLGVIILFIFYKGYKLVFG